MAICRGSRSSSSRRCSPPRYGPARVSATDRRFPGRADRRTADRRRDQALRPPVLARARPRDPGGRLHDRGLVPRRRRPRRVRARRRAVRARAQLRLGGGGRNRCERRTRASASGGRGRLPAARRLARAGLHRGLLLRARLVRALRPRSAERARRGPGPAGRSPARVPPRARRLRPRVRHRGRARGRRHRLDLLALAPAGGLRRTEHHHLGGHGRHRHVAALLRRVRTSLCRPEGAVRVGLTTTKEARCPSTSCCRA